MGVKPAEAYLAIALSLVTNSLDSVSACEINSRSNGSRWSNGKDRNIIA